MIDIRTVDGVFLIPKRSPFVIFSFMTHKGSEQIKNLTRKQNLYVLFAPRKLGKKRNPSSLSSISPLFSVRQLELICCEKMQTIVNLELTGALQWLHSKFPLLLCETWTFSYGNEWSRTIKDITKGGGMRSPLVVLKNVLIAQEENESIQELKEAAIGYLYLTNER
ncbi:hypothetical protein DRO24_01325 [Candidatus Bathyarchaeota archaeon]|nr:MAG: hypothetical protein DRO24_01325 [Candidatus Bathyarchaeota archaeon]